MADVTKKIERLRNFLVAEQRKSPSDWNGPAKALLLSDLADIEAALDETKKENALHKIVQNYREPELDQARAEVERLTHEVKVRDEAIDDLAGQGWSNGRTVEPMKSQRITAALDAARKKAGDDND